MKRKVHGFTLMEVLVTVILIAALVVAGAAGICSARRKAQCVVEMNAARNLMTAYLGHATDHGGRVLPGYQADAGATNIEGRALHYPTNARYPWRLAPSVPRIEGVMLFNGNEAALKAENSDYLVSVHPNLGLNATLVGGHFGTGSPLPPTPRLLETFGKFALTHLSESSAPEKLLVFASARSGETEPGYFEVRPPNLHKPVWSAAGFATGSRPASHGFIDLRWEGKAVCAMLGGNVELLDETKLRDMRRWSIQAEEANERDFLIQAR